jgi:hypothetical protein
MQPKQLFLAVDWAENASILHYFPLIEGCGTEKKVPKHILAFDDDYTQMIRKIKQFRRMSKEDQEFERKVASRYDSSDRNVFKKRLNSLMQLQTQLKAEMAGKAAAVAAPPAPARSITPPPPSATVARPSVSTASLGVQTDPTDILEACNVSVPAILREGTSREQLFDLSLRQQAGTRRRATTALGNDDQSGGEYVGGFSTAEDRQAFVENTNLGKRSAPGEGTRKQGERAKTVALQVRSAAMDAVHKAMKYAATAVDTCFLPDAFDHEPRQLVALLVYNELQPTKSQGGGVSARRLPKPELTIVTSNAKDMKKITTAYKTAVKHKNQSTIALKVFLSDLASHKVVPGVKEYVAVYEEQRKPPSTKPRPITDTFGEGDEN